MKIEMAIVAAALVALGAAVEPASAQPPKPVDKAASAQPPALNPAEFDQQLARMQDHMKQMQAQMDKIAQTQDPQERQRLLQEHWASMQAAMTVMRGMWGPGGASGPGMMMGGPMMGWNHMRGYYSRLTPEQQQQRQYMMDRYLPMQQMMMDHMLWHQRWVQPPPATTK